MTSCDVIFYEKVFNHPNELSQGLTSSEGVFQNTSTQSRSPSPTPQSSTTPTLIPAQKSVPEVLIPDPIPEIPLPAPVSESMDSPPLHRSECVQKPSELKKAADELGSQQQQAKEKHRAVQEAWKACHEARLDQ